MTTVSFGDKPAGTIATVALRKSAEMKRCLYPKAVEVILKNSYIDDIANSFLTQDKAQNSINEINDIVESSGCKIKDWITLYGDENGQRQLNKEEKVLGVVWDVCADWPLFKVKLNFSPKVGKVHNKPDLDLRQIPSNIPLHLTR